MSRKVLMIGGALILIALLLVCGPLSDRFGIGSKKAEPPSVAAGPPGGPAAGALGAAAAGALAGAQVGDSDLAATDALEEEDDPCRRDENGEFVNQSDRERLDRDCPPLAAGSDDVLAAAGGVVADTGASAGSSLSGAAAAAGAGAALAAGGVAAGVSASGSGGGAKGASSGVASSSGVGSAPAVSSGVPTNVAGGALAGAAGLAAAAAAADAFDSGTASATGANIPAGKIADRFPPPDVSGRGGSPISVAAVAQPFGVVGGNALKACDVPGSGCRNLTAGGPPSNPPIIPGTRPTPPGG